MEDVSKVSALRESLLPCRSSDKRIGLVPTMGNLHAGHLALIETARKQCDIVVASIFVNPTQFGPGEDFESYPRTLEQDLMLLRDAGCDLVFTPTVKEIYEAPETLSTAVQASAVSRGFCGEHRPGHFDGVATVVAKLFNIVSPHRAYFGLKDYQQFLVIKQLAADLAFDIDIVGVETVREPAGLALSSRNGYLSEEERSQAMALYKSLTQCQQAIRNGERDFRDLERRAMASLIEAGLQPEYFAICDAEDLNPPCKTSKDLVALTAARIGNTRLIDNIRFSLPEP